jgi:hypothetical protein
MGCEYLLQFYVRSSFLDTTHRSKMVIDPQKTKLEKKKKIKSSTVVGLCVLKKHGNKDRTTLFNRASRSSFELDTSKGGRAKEKSTKLQTL